MAHGLTALVRGCGLALALAVALASSATRAAVAIPPLTSPVMDQARMLSGDTTRLLDDQLTGLWKKGGSQIAVLTLDDLGGDAVEQVSIKAVEQWKLGTAKGDNGVLLLISKGDRKVRIEVGQGLEGALTDAYSRRIIADVITPAFKAGNIDIGVLRGVDAILRYTDPTEPSILQGGRQVASDRESESGGQHGFSLGTLVFLIILVVIISLFNGRGRGGGLWWGGGGGGFGGGGGGFSGGGGGFCGGGASGSW
jgi:uncharacterized protein